MKTDNDLILNDKLDTDGEMLVFIRDETVTWINRDDAMDIIHHLKIMFEIDLDKEI